MKSLLTAAWRGITALWNLARARAFGGRRPPGPTLLLLPLGRLAYWPPRMHTAVLEPGPRGPAELPLGGALPAGAGLLAGLAGAAGASKRPPPAVMPRPRGAVPAPGLYLMSGPKRGGRQP